MKAEQLMKEYKAGRLLPLPVPIGARVYIPFYDTEVDGTIDEGIEESCLSGYVNEQGRVFYLTYSEDGGSCDINPQDLCTTKEQAQHRLGELRKEKAHGQN